MATAAASLLKGLDSLSQEQLEKVIAQSRKTLKNQQKRGARADAEAEKRQIAEDEEQYRAEMDEIADDPDASQEEVDTTPKKRKTGPAGKGRYWNQSDEEGAKSSSDEEIPRAKKQRSGPAQRAGLEIIIGTPKKLAKKLPHRRGHNRSASTASSVTAVSSPSRPPPASSDPPSTPIQESDNSRPFTPYSTDHSVHKTQGKQSPVTKALLDTAYHHFRLKLALEDAFPADLMRKQMAKASFIEACNEDNVPRRLARFRADKLYTRRVSDSVADRVAQLCGEVKTKAQGLVSGQYRLASLSEDDLRKEIQHLTSRGTFHFSDMKERKGMFENMIIPMVLAEQWFKRKSAEGAGKYSKHFNPCPLPLIALILTAVKCALLDYETGLYAASANLFSQQEYSVEYERHIVSLEKYQKKAPQQFAKLQTKIWTDGWRIAGRNPPKASANDSDLDDDDFEEVLQREAGAA